MLPELPIETRISITIFQMCGWICCDENQFKRVPRKGKVKSTQFGDNSERKDPVCKNLKKVKSWKVDELSGYFRKTNYLVTSLK